MVAPAPEPAQDEEAATAAAVQVSETVAVDETSRHAFDLFVSYASEDRSIVEELVVQPKRKSPAPAGPFVEKS